MLHRFVLTISFILVCTAANAAGPNGPGKGTMLDAVFGKSKVTTWLIGPPPPPEPPKKKSDKIISIFDIFDADDIKVELGCCLPKGKPDFPLYPIPPGSWF
jgi:hypothetical protein